LQIRTETRVGLFIIVALGIFFYMTFYIGVFRLDLGNYKPYIVYFSDISGVLKKADVKIAGVKVGWVENIELVEDGLRARARVMIQQNYILYHNSYAVVRQEGLIGSKYLEIVPGDPSMPILNAGQELGQPGVAPVSVDDLMRQFKRIATHVEQVTESFSFAFGDQQGHENLRFLVQNLAAASERIASFSQTLDRVISNNEDHFGSIMSDVKEFARDMREVLPAFRENMDRIAGVFDRDFSGVADSFKSTANTIEEAAIETREGMKNIGDVASKINEGKGLIGKLVTEEDMYQDFKIAVEGLKNYFSRVERLGVVIDAHSETMYRPAEHFRRLVDSKGYFDVRVFPSEERFYIVGFMGSNKGNLYRTDSFRNWFDQNDCCLSQDGLELRDQFKFAQHKFTAKYKRDRLRLQAQFGKIFNDVALRFGIFEGTAGIGFDYDIPFNHDNLRWITTFEMFDFRGRQRLSDDRPHLKWLNRVFWLRNLYMVFGADDFVSKHNASAFVGIGLRFGDDDLKYLVSRFAINT